MPQETALCCPEESDVASLGSGNTHASHPAAPWVPLNPPRGSWEQVLGKEVCSTAFLFFMDAWQKLTILLLPPKDRYAAKILLSKGLGWPNLQPGKLKNDWVLDMVICCAHVYLGSHNQPEW